MEKKLNLMSFSKMLILLKMALDLMQVKFTYNARQRWYLNEDQSCSNMETLRVYLEWLTN